MYLDYGNKDQTMGSKGTQSVTKLGAKEEHQGNAEEGKNISKTQILIIEEHKKASNYRS